MGIFDFFKAKPKKVEPESVKFEEIESFILAEKEKARIEEVKCIEVIKKNLKILATEFDNEIKVINSLDLKERKIEEKVRLIVLDNAKTFANYLKRLKESLESLQTEKLESLIEDINKNLLEFKKKSYTSHEKARYLIGDELEAVTISMDSFYENASQVLKENETLILNSKIINNLENIYISIKKTIELINNIEEELGILEENKNNFDKQIKVIESKIISYSKSEKYLNFINKKQEFEKEKQEIKKEIYQLRELLDLKELAKIYHSSPKNIKIINEYAQNIEETFERDKGNSILELVDHNKPKIVEKINKILYMEHNLASFNLEKDELAEIKKEISHIQVKINDIAVEKSKLEKRESQSKTELADIMPTLSNELAKLNFKLE